MPAGLAATVTAPAPSAFAAAAARGSDWKPPSAAAAAEAAAGLASSEAAALVPAIPSLIMSSAGWVDTEESRQSTARAAVGSRWNGKGAGRELINDNEPSKESEGGRNEAAHTAWMDFEGRAASRRVGGRVPLDGLLGWRARCHVGPHAGRIIIQNGARGSGDDFRQISCS